MNMNDENIPLAKLYWLTVSLRYFQKKWQASREKRWLQQVQHYESLVDELLAALEADANKN